MDITEKPRDPARFSQSCGTGGDPRPWTHFHSQLRGFLGKDKLAGVVDFGALQPLHTILRRYGCDTGSYGLLLHRYKQYAS